MFFAISRSTDPNIIGPVRVQAARAELSVEIKHPFLSRNVLFKEMPIEKVITPTPVIEPRAKLTDLLSGSAVGNGMQLMISEKLKDLISKENHPGIQFFPMQVIYKKKVLNNYWLSNPFAFDFDAIDYETSIFEVRRYGITPIKEVSVDNEKTFFNMKEALQEPEALTIKKLAIKKKSQNLLLFIHVDGGIQYCVSEKLKMEIEAAGCTGIAFSPVE